MSKLRRLVFRLEGDTNYYKKYPLMDVDNVGMSSGRMVGEEIGCRLADFISGSPGSRAAFLDGFFRGVGSAFMVAAVEEIPTADERREWRDILAKILVTRKGVSELGATFGVASGVVLVCEIGNVGEAGFEGCVSKKTGARCVFCGADFNCVDGIHCNSFDRPDGENVVFTRVRKEK